MPQRVQLGLIGVGNILPSHLDALAQLPEFEVVSVCDSDPERRRKVAAELDAAAFADYREQLAAGPGAVLVALPHGLHCEVAVAALEAGCHTLVEKPMAVSAAAACSATSASTGWPSAGPACRDSLPSPSAPRYRTSPNGRWKPARALWCATPKGDRSSTRRWGTTPDRSG